MRQTIFLLALLCSSFLSFSQTSIIPFGSSWKYLDNGSNQGTAWRSITFDDEEWKNGIAKLGYGEGDEATVVGYGNDDNDRYVTTYFRKIVTIGNIAQFGGFKGSIRRDDGAVIYINGIEVFRTNMPAGAISYNTLAATGADNDDGRVEHPFSINSTAFTTGINVLAVEVHQSSVSSSDISFDLELEGLPGGASGPDRIPPTVQRIERQLPIDSETSATVVTFRVIFSEAVAGVDVSDFSLTLSEGIAGNISSVSGGGNTYDVMVNVISGAGTLRLNLNSGNTGIEDDADNVIDGGFTGGESYTIRPASTGNTAPLILGSNRLLPLDATTSVNSVVFRVIFSEAVSGVGASDFTLTKTGNVEGTIVAVSGTGSTYDVTVNSIEGEGTIRLDLKGSGTSISDVDGNLLEDEYTSGQTYIINKPAGPQPSTTLTRGPYLQAASQTGITLRWRTSVATNSKIDVGTTHGSYTLSATNATITSEHEVRITGLEAGAKYYYRFGSTSQVLQSGADNYFYTAPATTTTKKIRVAVFGDCGRANSTQRSVLNAYLNYVGNSPAELMLLLGDNAYSDGTDAEFQKAFFEPYGNTILKNHVVFPSPGNHDYHTTSPTARNAPYFKNFTMPTEGESGGVPSGTESFYSFDWGDVHFVSLDTEGEELDGSYLYDTTGVQVSWLKRDLAANTKKWTIVFLHHPPHTKGTHNSDNERDLYRIRQNLVPILERYGVDLMMGGHSHNYERSYLLKGYYGTEAQFDRSNHAVTTSSGKYNGSSNSCPFITSAGKVSHGIVYVVSGNASRSGDDVHDGFPHDALPYATRDGGMFYIELEDNRLDGKSIGQDGKVFDQFTILKDVNKTSVVTVSRGGQVVLSASWIGEYEWSTGATTRSITVASTSNKTYTVRDNRNCLRDAFDVKVITTSASAKTNMDSTSEIVGAMRGIKVYPVLVRKGQSITVQTNTNEMTEVELIDNYGRLIRGFNFIGNTTIETASMAAGTYFIHLRLRNNVNKQKIVVAD